MSHTFQLAFFPAPAEKPLRSRKYKQWIKSLACLVCRTHKHVDPCHTGPHGISTKASDLNCLPFCRRHHNELDASPRIFARKYRLNIPKLIELHNRRWEVIQGGKRIPAVKVRRAGESGRVMRASASGSPERRIA